MRFKTLYLSLLLVFSQFIGASASEWQIVKSSEPSASSVTVLQSDLYSSTLRFDLQGYYLEEVNTPRGLSYIVHSPGGTALLETGSPDLPKFALSLLIPDKGSMKAEVLDARFTDVSAIDIAPSKGNLTRNIQPLDVPYRYGSVYNRNEFWPSATHILNEPYIFRDFRGQSVWMQPFAYNPVNRQLRVYSEITIRVSHLPVVPGSNELNRSALPTSINGYFAPIYKNHFGNLPVLAYTPLEENTGKMLIICHGPWMSLMQPFVEWKTKKGIEIEMVDVITAGGTAQNIQAYISNYYQNNNLTFVLLVGDAPQVPTLSSAGGASDPSYGYLLGNDSYPEVMVGRFSAETPDDVSTQVQRVVKYERYPDPLQGWYNQGVVIGSNEGPGDDNEMDWEHAANMRTDLINFTYGTVSELYDGTHPGTTDMPGDPSNIDLFNLFQSGISLMTYTGHGSNTSCATTGLSNNDIQNMTNSNKLPFIWAVACVNGEFDSPSGPCFAEKFMRARVNDEPTGAVATLMSSINQSWNPPMDGQDEMVDILSQQYPSNLKYTFGGLSVNGCMKMNDDYGAAGDEMTDTWHIFGDPTLNVRTSTPQSMTVNHTTSIPVGLSNLNVNCSNNGALVSLTMNGQIIGTGIVVNGNVVVSFAAINAPDTIFVTVTGFNQIPYEGQVLVIPASGPYVIYQSCGVQDPTGNNNGLADFGESITVDLTLQNVGLADANGVNAVISTTDPYITLTGTAAAIGTITSSSSATQTGAFSFNVANNVPDQHPAQFTISVTDNSGNSWSSGFVLLLQAPVLKGGILSIDDNANGDGDGQLEAGETAILTIRCLNDGHSDAPASIASISTFSSFLTIVNNSALLGTINKQGYSDALFTISMAPNVTVGTAWDVQLSVVSGQYSATKSYNGTAGIILEDFETNNFNRFNWILSGNTNWFTSTSLPYEGLYCAESGNIGDSEISELSIVINCLADDSVSFWYKTDSEQSWDFLRFYMDGILMGEWSGNTSLWSYAGFPLLSGSHTLRFAYEKDSYLSTGLDAVWLDNIRFPVGTQTTSIEQITYTKGLAVWPNPARERVMVKLPENSDRNLQYFLFDAKGMMVASSRINEVNSNQFEVPVLGFAAGVYQLVVRGEQSNFSTRFSVHP